MATSRLRARINTSPEVPQEVRVTDDIPRGSFEAMRWTFDKWPDIGERESNGHRTNKTVRVLKGRITHGRAHPNPSPSSFAGQSGVGRGGSQARPKLYDCDRQHWLSTRAQATVLARQSGCRGTRPLYGGSWPPTSTTPRRGNCCGNATYRRHGCLAGFPNLPTKGAGPSTAWPLIDGFHAPKASGSPMWRSASRSKPDSWPRILSEGTQLLRTWRVRLMTGR